MTGMGAVHSCRTFCGRVWQFKKGQNGFAPITYFDTSDYKVKLAAELKGFDPAGYMDFKSARRMEAFCQYAVAAAASRGI